MSPESAGSAGVPVLPMKGSYRLSTLPMPALLTIVVFGLVIARLLKK
jgi:hypothetical protein